jgi:hypothetical protein
MEGPSSAPFSGVDRARSCPRAVTESVEEGETGNSGEDAVGRHESDADVNGTRNNPQVIGVNTIGQGMAGVAAIEPDRRHRREESVADRDDRRRGNGPLQLRTSR